MTLALPAYLFSSAFTKFSAAFSNTGSFFFSSTYSLSTAILPFSSLSRPLAGAKTSFSYANEGSASS